MNRSSLLFLLLAVSPTFAQGPLTPDGEPQPTMKTLHQVEPRKAIAGGTDAITINTSGSYYLTGDLTVSSGDGITIAAGNVTLDLNGFTVSSTSAEPAGNAITLGDSLLAVTIRNGNLGGGFASGVRYVQGGDDPDAPYSVRVSDLMVSRVTVAAIDLGNPSQCGQVERCSVFSHGAPVGIVATIVRDCTVGGAGITASIVRDCHVTGPGTGGIVADVVDRCVVFLYNGGIGIDARCVSNSRAGGSSDNDVVSAGVAHNVWADGDGNSGTALKATVAGNSVGRKIGAAPSDIGKGVSATVVDASVGLAVGGAGIDGQVVTASHGSAVSQHGIFATQGVVSHSLAASGTGSALLTTQGVVTGSVGRTTTGLVGIDNNNGVVSASRGSGADYGINTHDYKGCVSNSVGRGADFTGILSGLITGSEGIGADYGIGGLLIHGSFGWANGPPPTDDIFGLFKFDSN